MCCVFIDDVTLDIYLIVKVTVVSSFVCRQIGHRTELIEGRGAKGMEVWIKGMALNKIMSKWSLVYDRSSGGGRQQRQIRNSDISFMYVVTSTRKSLKYCSVFDAWPPQKNAWQQYHNVFNFYFGNSPFETTNYVFLFPIMPTDLCSMWSNLDFLQVTVNFD